MSADIIKQDSMSAENRGLLLDGAAKMWVTIINASFLTGR